jgi:hypothetical protein
MRDDEKRKPRRKEPKKPVANIFSNRLGVQIEGRVRGRQQWLDPNWNVQIHAKWRDVEAVQGTYDWSPYRDDFLLLSGHPVVVGLKVVPEWARLWPEYVGSPPKPEFYSYFGAMAANLVAQYNHPKQLVLEIFNEPDADRDDVKKGTQDLGDAFGCWVMGKNWAEGGRRYGECLKMVYPIIKAAHPQVKILAGALIGEPSSFIFLEAALKAGLMADGISFHKYAHYGIRDQRGPFEFAAKLKRMTTWPLVMTETSLLAKEDSAAFRQAQGAFLSSLLKDFDELGIDAMSWYSLADQGWMNSDLVWRGIAQPAYEVYKRGIPKKAVNPRPVRPRPRDERE